MQHSHPSQMKKRRHLLQILSYCSAEVCFWDWIQLKLTCVGRAPAVRLYEVLVSLGDTLKGFLTCPRWGGRRPIPGSNNGKLQPLSFFISLCRTTPFLAHPAVYSFCVSHWRLPLLCYPEYSPKVLLWEVGALRLNPLRLGEKLGL